jgi:hypothetical protein
MELLLTWIDRRGRPTDDIEGYNAADYFADQGLADARCLLGDGNPTMALNVLDRTYKGPDCDGIGLRWEVV